MSIIPDSDKQAFVESWAEQQAALLPRLGFGKGDRFHFICAETGKSDGIPSQQLINAALLIDWSCYDLAADRADYARLRDVITVFPQGFRIWFSSATDQTYWPVGYTGWYPLEKKAFDKIYNYPTTVRHRKELRPQARCAAEENYIWLFNYSIIAPLRRTALSKKMLAAYAGDLRQVKISGMAAATISEEGKKVASRFGLGPVGVMSHDGVSEAIYAKRYG